jgi:transposase
MCWIALIENVEASLQRNIRAVEAAVTERWSNGPVEGHVNCLKTTRARWTATPYRTPPAPG